MTQLAETSTDGWSHRRAVDRFNRPAVADNYPMQFLAHGRDRRERACVLSALRGVAPDSRVLDLPCGAGRVSWELAKEGYRVTGVDSSSFMVDRALAAWPSLWAKWSLRPDAVSFHVGDALATGFANSEFDAVVCNRLFHHLTESDVRIAALRELGRVCRGPLVVSFFNSFSLSWQWRRMRAFVYRRTPKDRIAIAFGLFSDEAAQAGLRVDRRIATRWGVSPHWYVVLRRST